MLEIIMIASQYFDDSEFFKESICIKFQFVVVKLDLL